MLGRIIPSGRPFLTHFLAGLCQNKEIQHFLVIILSDPFCKGIMVPASVHDLTHLIHIVLVYHLTDVLNRNRPGSDSLPCPAILTVFRRGKSLVSSVICPVHVVLLREIIIRDTTQSPDTHQEKGRTSEVSFQCHRVSSLKLFLSQCDKGYLPGLQPLRFFVQVPSHEVFLRDQSVLP